MVKKRRTLTIRRKLKKKKDQSSQFVRVLIGLLVLVILVLVAGFLTHRLLRQSQPLKSLARHQELESWDASELPFELYPQEEIPSTKSTTEPAIPFTGKLPKIAIIIDDIGYDYEIVEKFIQSKLPLTLSILPQSPFQKDIIESARGNGYDLMLHQPMEPDEYPQIKPGPGALLSAMSPDELISQLQKNLTEITSVKGVNNHMGSKMTANESQMRQIFSVLKRKGLFFIDSRTTTATICRPSANLLQVPFAERDVFLDHIQDEDFILKQFKELVRIARKHGEAIGIAHPSSRTYYMLQKIIPELEDTVEFVPVSALVKKVG